MFVLHKFVDYLFESRRLICVKQLQLLLLLHSLFMLDSTRDLDILEIFNAFSDLPNCFSDLSDFGLASIWFSWTIYIALDDRWFTYCLGKSGELCLIALDMQLQVLCKCFKIVLEALWQQRHL